MPSSTRTILRAAAVALLLGAAPALTLPAPVSAAEEVNIQNGYAVHGYDVVAYFTAGKPTPGVDAFTAEHGGAKYRFASAANRDAFKADPAKFAPQFGGFCAFGASMGRKFDGDPNAWAVVDGKLYLNVNQTVQQRWDGNRPGFIKGANNNWPKIATIADADLEKAPPAGLTLGAQ